MHSSIHQNPNGYSSTLPKLSHVVATVVKNPNWYEGCDKQCSYYISEYLYYDCNGNAVDEDRNHLALSHILDD